MNRKAKIFMLILMILLIMLECGLQKLRFKHIIFKLFLAKLVLIKVRQIISNYKFKMSYDQEDLGQFNESTVFLQPIRFSTAAVPAINKNHNPQSTFLGIYNTIKLTSLAQNKVGEVIQFISLDEHSHTTLVTNAAIALLQRYATDDIAFMVVVGNKRCGKSFFCDKILNLSQVRGNHFCRKKNKGINIWSSPYQKDNLKIFLLQIANCDIASQQFKILSTYTLLIGSLFVVIDDISLAQHNTIKELDQVICDIVDKITPSKIQKGEDAIQNKGGFLPKIFYNLGRLKEKKPVQNLSLIKYYAPQYLPDALQKGYVGKSDDLVHVPFLDTKCVSEQYINRVSAIFKDIYAKIQQKKYNQLVLNGNIIIKIIRYIESYLTKKQQLNMETLYEKIINDLYQSAYSYCILSYHDDMQRELQDQHPKSLVELLEIFQSISDSVFSKFQEFNLDRKVHQIYQQKLQRHIDQKQQMLIQINLKKTQQVIFQIYQQKQIGNVQYYRALLDRISRQYNKIDHGKANVIAKINLDFYKQIKADSNVQYKIMKQIQNLKQNITQQKVVLQQIKQSNQQKQKQKSHLDKQQQEHLAKDSRLRSYITQLNDQIVKATNQGDTDPSHKHQQINKLNQTINNNRKIIEQLKSANTKDQRVTTLQNRLQELKKKIIMQQNLLRQLKENNPDKAEPKNENAGSKPSDPVKEKLPAQPIDKVAVPANDKKQPQISKSKVQAKK